ncbi:hypothetical protein QTP88_000550 [Uroleucon formosanum]
MVDSDFRVQNIGRENVKKKLEVFDSFSVIDTTVPSETTIVKSLTENVNQNSFNSLNNISTDPAKWPLIINNDLAHELKSVSAMVDDNLTPYELLTFMINAGDFAPNLSIALRILLTLPVSVATGERSFSKLKLIKTYLRSTMKNERLCGLTMISIEHEVGQELTDKKLVHDFAKLKARKRL